MTFNILCNKITEKFLSYMAISIQVVFLALLQTEK